MPSLKLNSGINWFYDLEGEGGAVFFIHGWGVDRRIWRQQFKHFSRFFKVVTVDLPGHGKTTWGEISLAKIAQDLQEILEILGLQKVHLVSSSFGGLVALKMFEAGPEKITSIVFAGSQPKFIKSPDYPFGLDTARVQKLAGQLKTDYPAIVNVFFRSLFTKQERETRRFKWIQTFRRADIVPPQEALLGLLSVLEQADLRETLYRVVAPVLFVNGTEDYICPKEIFVDLQKRVPHAQVSLFEHCGHFPFLTHPYEFNQVLADFWAEHK
jgi:pimeloyl-[acyl-carrier protein] methyl ester esterase